MNATVAITGAAATKRQKVIASAGACAVASAPAMKPLLHSGTIAALPSRCLVSMSMSVSFFASK